MGRDEVRKALEAMDDEATRAQMAAGDLSALEGEDLTDEERAMIVAAADDYPEVVGFSFNALTGGSLGIYPKITGDGSVTPTGAVTPTDHKLSGPYANAAKIAGVFKF